jgi:hypothetical protein
MELMLMKKGWNLESDMWFKSDSLSYEFKKVKTQ